MLSETRDTLKRTDNSLVTAILVVALLYFARDVFVPLALAGLLAFLLAPAASLLERWGIRRTAAALLVILFASATVGALGWIVLGQIYNLAVELPQYQQNVTDKIGSLHLDSAGKLSRTVEMLTNVSKQIKSGGTTVAPILPAAPRQRRAARSAKATPELANKTAQPVSVRIEEPEESMLAVAGRTAMPLLHPLTTTFIVVIFLIFMLLGRDDLRDRGIRLAGSGRMHVTATAIEDASRRVSRYLQMQLVVNLCYGTAVGILLRSIGVPHPLLWAVLTGLLRFVPYIGILMAAAGPLLLSIAISPSWSELAWTVMTFVVLEIVTANFVEPALYSASTGISAIAILVAAVFWTVLWGLPGLLLSTPLTVCLVVLGRQVPHLHYLEVLFGEETGLPASDRFYQRVLASNTRQATAMIDDLLKTKSRAEVYDAVLIPALTMIEEARHTEEMTATRAETFLQGIEELAEENVSRVSPVSATTSESQLVMCVPAADFADEVACRLALQVFEDAMPVRVIAADCSMPEIKESVDRMQPAVVCVVGLPPRAIRYVRMRCHQIRARFPDVVVVACVLNEQSDLSSLRSRIPTEDAQHVVCSLQLLKAYLLPLLRPEVSSAESLEQSPEDAAASKSLSPPVHKMDKADVFDGPEEGMFQRLATNLARSLDAPIALVTVKGGQRGFWEAQCGLPEDRSSAISSGLDLSICRRIVFSDSILVISDTEADERFASDPFLRANGVRFYAGAPLKAKGGEVIGSLCVLDTRPREMTEQQKDTLKALANAAMTAIELRDIVSAEEVASQEAP